jgi:hypothetical protein
MPPTTTIKAKGESSRLQTAKANEKIYVQNPLGLVKNRQTPKTLNKGKKVVWGKECPGSNSCRDTANSLKQAIQTNPKSNTPPGVQQHDWADKNTRIKISNPWINAIHP